MAALLFDAAMLTLFFEDANNMGLSHCTRLQLAVEGITVPKGIKEFDNKDMKAIFTNLLKPPKVPATGATARAAGTLGKIQAYEVSAKSKMRLNGVMLIAKFYDDVGHPLDPNNMLWPVIKRFLEQWKALMERKKADHGQPPKLTKNQAVHRWVDSFVLHLSQIVGVCNAPLDYVVHAIAAVDPIPPAHQLGDPHSIQMSSIDGDLMDRMPHNHPLFKVDNGLTFNMIKMSVRGHDVAVMIAPFHCGQDGHGALLALQSQHASKAINDQLVKVTENILKNRTWLGTTLVTLSQHMGLHRKAYITLTECAEHIPIEIPNDQAQVTYLLDSFKTIDPSVFAAIAAVCQNDANKRINFKNAFTFLAPSCPVLAKAAKKGRVSFEANVSSATGGKPHQGGLGGDHEKPGKGMTGAALCYHKFEEFKNLSKEQQDELTKWNRANGGKNEDRKKGKCSPTVVSPHRNKSDNTTKKLKSMNFEMEARQNKLFEEMADVQTTSVAAIQAAAASPAPSPRATGVGAVVGSAATVAPEVMIEHANVAMLKLTGILKLKDNKA
jgi:hypothetical protein